MSFSDERPRGVHLVGSIPLANATDVGFDEPKQGVVDRLVALSHTVPVGVEMGFHLCYGDFGHRHFKEPADAGTLVEMSNAISAAVERPVTWIHAPVPRSRDDDAYFAPFDELRLQPATRYYLGLLHYTDGVEGATRRLRVARTWLTETIEPLLRLHSEIAGAVA